MSSLRDLVGVELEPTNWLEVSQARIDEFATVPPPPPYLLLLQNP